MRAADGPRTGKMDGSREVCSSSRLGHDSGGFIGHIRITLHPLDVVVSFVPSSAVGVGWRPLVPIFAASAASAGSAGRWARPIDAVAPVTEPTAL